MAWRGLPSSHPDQVVFGLLHEAATPMLATCKDFILVVDGQPMHFVPEYSAARGAPPAREVLQVRLNVPTLRTIAAAEHIDLKACSVERAFSPQALAVAKIFAERFQERLRTQEATAAGSEVDGAAQQ